MSKLKRIFFKGFVIFHLGTLLLYAGRLDNLLPDQIKPLRHIIILYSQFTQGNHRFGFFAPDIPPYYTFTFNCETDSGAKFQYDFNMPNREVEVRFNRLLRTVSLKGSRELMFKSLVNYIKKKRPDVVKVNIKVIQMDTPIMSDYKKGIRKPARLMYNVNFSC